MNAFHEGKVAFFVTGNVHKFNEARDVLSKFNIATAMLNIEAVEIQDDNLKKIATASAADAAKKSNLPVFVEDAGLFVKALNGFPGPYSSYVYRTVDTKGILKLLQNERRRDAYFLSVVAFSNPQEVTPLSPGVRISYALPYPYMKGSSLFRVSLRDVNQPCKTAGQLYQLIRSSK